MLIDVQVDAIRLGGRIRSIRPGARATGTCRIGDGVGPDIWSASRRVIDAAVSTAYEGTRQIAWMEVLAGAKAHDATGEWLPDEMKLFWSDIFLNQSPDTAVYTGLPSARRVLLPILAGNDLIPTLERTREVVGIAESHHECNFCNSVFRGGEFVRRDLATYIVFDFLVVGILTLQLTAQGLLAGTQSSCNVGEGRQILIIHQLIVDDARHTVRYRAEFPGSQKSL